MNNSYLHLHNTYYVLHRQIVTNFWFRRKINMIFVLVIVRISSNWITGWPVSQKQHISPAGVCLRVSGPFEMTTPTLGSLCQLFLFLDAFLYLLLDNRFFLQIVERPIDFLSSFVCFFLVDSLGFFTNIPRGSSDCLLTGTMLYGVLWLLRDDLLLE